MTRDEWRKQVVEAAIEPDLPIIDSHHHLWAHTPMEPWEPYTAADMAADIDASGHNVIGTVLTDSHANYATTGPEHMRVVGECHFVEGVVQEFSGNGRKSAGLCSVFVSAADLTLGARVGEVLDAQIAASPRYRGIRHMTAIDPDLDPVYGGTEYGVMMRPEFREGFAELVKRGLSFDAWMFHPQLPDLLDLARAFPEANIVLDHVGGPIGIGRFAGKRADTFAAWRIDMAAIAACPNVAVKLGGLNMSYTALDATDEPRPHTSEEVAALQGDYIRTTIDLFGPDRCMFESNFPVDMRSITYDVVWNSFKRMSAPYSRTEREQLFAGTARRVYRMAG